MSGAEFPTEEALAWQPAVLNLQEALLSLISGVTEAGWKRKIEEPQCILKHRLLISRLLSSFTSWNAIKASRTSRSLSL